MPEGTLKFLETYIPPGVGLGSAGAPVGGFHGWGVGDCLFGSDEAGNFENPVIAEDYQLAPDLSHVDITVRPGVLFHHGWGEETADDWVWTFNNANGRTNPESIHGQAGDFAALFGEAEVIDKYTFRLPLVSYDIRWSSFFLSDAGQSTTCFSKKAYDERGPEWMKENIIGDGPLQVVEWIWGDRAVLEKRPDGHWRIDPAFERVVFLGVGEEATRVAMLKTGEADAGWVEIRSMPGLVEMGFVPHSPALISNVHSIIWSGNYWESQDARVGEPLERPGYCDQDLPWVGCNLGCPADDYGSSQCKDPGDMDEARHIRRALAFAIDRELLNETVLEGLGTYGTLEYVDTRASYYRKEWDVPYDPELARREMMMADDEKWREGEFDVALWTGGEYRTINKELNDAIMGMWKAIWPKMNVEVLMTGYSIIRPSLVGRTNTIPYCGDCDEGSANIPFDWPHGISETSLTRRGFGCGIEIPKIVETFLAVNKELDKERRIHLNEQLVAYLVDQQLMTGTVQIPLVFPYNPKSIKEWPRQRAVAGRLDRNVEAIVPAR